MSYLLFGLTNSFTFLSHFDKSTQRFEPLTFSQFSSSHHFTNSSQFSIRFEKATQRLERFQFSSALHFISFQLYQFLPVLHSLRKIDAKTRAFGFLSIFLSTSLYLLLVLSIPPSPRFASKKTTRRLEGLDFFQFSSGLHFISF